MATNKRKIVNDPVFGFINLPSELIFKLLQHPFVQRMTRIKQLGMTFYVYPGTQHTRFQHSLGALHLMTEAVKTLREKGHEITDAEADGVYAAILLHDIGHGPFSHTLEGWFFDQISHEEVGLAIIEQLNRSFGGQLDITLQILRDQYPKRFLHELVSGQLDMDRLDYLRRDSFFSGVSEGNIGSARIIKMLNIQNDKLVVDAKGIYSIENFLMSRRLMYWQVYFHKTAFAADHMLRKTLDRARWLEQRGADLYATDALKYFLRQSAGQVNDESLEAFRQLDDSDIWVALKAWQKHPDKVLSLLSSGMVNRNIFRLEISNKPFGKERIESQVSELKDALGLNDEEVSFLYFENKVSTHLYKDNETGIDILYNDGSAKSISEASDMFDIQLLSRKMTKHYFSYYRLPK
ncbi:MAG: HD domain-containing protein [Paludibacteraceae bacterium]|nr:HD domain-containing protein [Paludibacteraceae bacterium]